MRPFRLHAEFCRTVANPKRLEILELLRSGQSSVTELARAMGLALANVSQELAPLRIAGIVRAHRDGKTVRYALASPKVLRACDLLAEAMRELDATRASAFPARRRRPEIFVPRANRG